MILILDFGSQYTQLIARKIRELRVYCEVHPFHQAKKALSQRKWQGMILSGGPRSVYDDNTPLIEKELLEQKIPVLGICYGMQLIAFLYGGKVEEGTNHEYGGSQITTQNSSRLFQNFDNTQRVHPVWMSHSDHVISLPSGFSVIAWNEKSQISAMSNEEKQIYALQFHPEVNHTKDGRLLLENFVYGICACPPNWDMQHFYQQKAAELKDNFSGCSILSAVSGGVDSLVATKLAHDALGSQITTVFVDNGLLRAKETAEVLQSYQDALGAPPRVISAQDYFLAQLKGVTDPEEKRRKIGHAFIKVFEEEVIGGKKFDYLLQGTLYPDVIESVAVSGPSVTIKSHHNVGGLPEKMALKLLEPLRSLFKDEVRALGEEMGIASKLLNRHPFPGPGLAVRVIGEVNAERLDILRRCDKILIEELHKADWYNKVWQAFAVLLPVKSVGIKGDFRHYSDVIGLRCVNSSDAMTADWAKLPHSLLAVIASRIVNEVTEISRVVYDITSKPPATIEWE